MNNEDVVNSLMPIIQEYTEIANNLVKSRFLVLASEIATNDEELSAIDNLANDIECKIVQNGSSVSLSVDYKTNNNFLDVIQEGMDAPLTGGNNGIVTEPDGSTRSSNVPEQLWGHPINMYAKAGTDVINEVKTMLNTLFKNYVQDVVSNNKDIVAKLVKEEILKQIKR